MTKKCVITVKVNEIYNNYTFAIEDNCEYLSILMSENDDDKIYSVMGWNKHLNAIIKWIIVKMDNTYILYDSHSFKLTTKNKVKKVFTNGNTFIYETIKCVDHEGSKISDINVGKTSNMFEHDGEERMTTTFEFKHVNYIVHDFDRITSMIIVHELKNELMRKLLKQFSETNNADKYHKEIILIGADESLCLYKVNDFTKCLNVLHVTRDNKFIMNQNCNIKLCENIKTFNIWQKLLCNKINPSDVVKKIDDMKISQMDKYNLFRELLEHIYDFIKVIYMSHYENDDVMNDDNIKNTYTENIKTMILFYSSYTIITLILEYYETTIKKYEEYYHVELLKSFDDNFPVFTDFLSVSLKKMSGDVYK
jgi:hypothetical protein